MNIPKQGTIRFSKDFLKLVILAILLFLTCCS